MICLWCSWIMFLFACCVYWKVLVRLVLMIDLNFLLVMCMSSVLWVIFVLVMSILIGLCVVLVFVNVVLIDVVLVML